MPWMESIRLESRLSPEALERRLADELVSFAALSAWGISRFASRAGLKALERPLYGRVTKTAMVLLAARSFGNPMRVVCRCTIAPAPGGSLLTGRLGRSLLVAALFAAWIGYFLHEVVSAVGRNRLDLAAVFGLGAVFLGILIVVSYVRSRADSKIILQALRDAMDASE